MGEGTDIFQILLDEEKRRREKRTKFLESIGVKEFFENGRIEIDYRICQGIECKICIKACPTSALYWGLGRVNAITDICVYCTACVLNCIVDKCIKVRRKRNDGKTEVFSTPREAITLLHSISARKRFDLVTRVFSALK